MSDLTPRDPTAHDPELRAQLRAAGPPEHHDGFWRAVDDQIDLVHGLRSIPTPDHLDGFWARLDGRLLAEPDHELPAEVVAPRTTVFDDAAVVPLHPRRARRLTQHRLQRLVQISAAAAVVAVLAGGVAWWGTREDDSSSVAVPRTTVTSSTTVGVPPPTTVPPLLDEKSRVTDIKPLPAATGSATAATVPVGASPDGKFLYVAGPAQSNERCSFGSAGSTAAKWIYAQPVDGTSPSHRILTDYVFADPRLTVGPNQKVVVSDSCNGPTKHVIADAEPNGALIFDQEVDQTVPLAVDGAAWSASGTGLFFKGVSANRWYRYNIATEDLEPIAAADIAPNANVIEQLANEKIVSVTRRDGTWAVSIGTQEIIAINAPRHGDFSRAVRVDTRHDQLAIAGNDKLLVLTARAGEVAVGTYSYAAAALSWVADGNGLVAAKPAGGIDYLSFTPAADSQPGTATEPTAVSLGFDGAAYSVLSVPTSPTLVVRRAVGQGEAQVPGESLSIQLE